MTDQEKLTVYLPAEKLAVAKRLAKSRNTTFTEIVRRGIAIAAIIDDAERAGRKLVLTSNPPPADTDTLVLAL